PVVLLALARRPVVGGVEVLAPPGRVDASRLQLRARARRDPHVAPGRRDDELLDASQPIALDRCTAAVHVPKRSPAAEPSPPSAPRHLRRPSRYPLTVARV